MIRRTYVIECDHASRCVAKLVLPALWVLPGDSVPQPVNRARAWYLAELRGWTKGPAGRHLCPDHASA